MSKHFVHERHGVGEQTLRSHNSQECSNQHSKTNSWTDLRVEEIKRKYENPLNKQNVPPNRTKQNHMLSQPPHPPAYKTPTTISKPLQPSNSRNIQSMNHKSIQPSVSNSAQLYSTKSQYPKLKVAQSSEQSRRHYLPVKVSSYSSIKALERSQEDSKTHYNPRRERIKTLGDYQGNEKQPFIGNSNEAKYKKDKPASNRTSINRHEEKYPLQNRLSLQDRKEKNMENYLQEEDMEVLQKIYEMKQSLARGTRAKASEGNMTKSRRSRLMRCIGKDNFSPRVESIDNINKKIKSILQCLSQQNQLENQGYAEGREGSLYNKGTQRSRGQFWRQGNQQQLEETKVLCQKKFTYYKEDNAGSMKKSFNDSFSKDNENSQPKSCLGTLDIKNKSSWDQKGQKFTSEMNDIQLRIEKLNEEKRRLNIDFKPFHYEKRNYGKEEHKASLSASKHSRYSFSIDNKSQLECVFRNQKSDDEAIKKQASEGIQERRRKLKELAMREDLYESKKLIACLCKQTKLDEALRDAKIWFSEYTSAKKWEELIEALKARSYLIHMTQAQRLFEISEEQNNPFYSIRESSCSVEALVESYLIAEKHWANDIVGSFDGRRLFQVEKLGHQIDLENKQYFVLQDLVRLLNFETGVFFRNRDLVLIFRRIHGKAGSKAHALRLCLGQLQDLLSSVS